jgi:HEAT repeat protein
MSTRASEQQRIEHHIANLHSPDQKVASRAEYYLTHHYGSRAKKQLIQACSHPSPVVRYRAVWALAYTHDPDAYETILRLCEDPEESVCYDATIALGILGDLRALEPLTQMYLSDDITRPVGMAFSRMGLKSVPALIEVLRKGSPHVRHSVVHVLGGFAKEAGDQQCLALLEKCRNDPDSTVRESAEHEIEEIRKSASRGCGV